MGKKEKAGKAVATGRSAFAQEKGVAKKKLAKKEKKQRKVAAKADAAEEVGVVAKKKKRFFAVAVGTHHCSTWSRPCIYPRPTHYEKLYSTYSYG